MPKSCGRRRWRRTTSGSSASRKKLAGNQTPAPSRRRLEQVPPQGHHSQLAAMKRPQAILFDVDSLLLRLAVPARGAGAGRSTSCTASRENRYGPLRPSVVQMPLSASFRQPLEGTAALSTELRGRKLRFAGTSWQSPSALSAASVEGASRLFSAQSSNRRPTLVNADRQTQNPSVFASNPGGPSNRRMLCLAPRLPLQSR
jgi:hypothetical protein